MSEETIKKINKERLKREKTLFSIPGVVGVGTGYKVVGGERTEQICMRIYVVKKEKESKIPASLVIPKMFTLEDKIEILTDVIESGIIYAQSYTGRYRPAPNGVSIGHFRITAGTLGIIARDNSTGNSVILSNNHVLANSNNASVNDAILQPGPHDGGTTANDTIARLLRWQPIIFSGGNNEVDAAIALPINPADVSNNFICSQIGANDPAVGLLFAGSSTLTVINHIQTVLNTLNISLFRPVVAASLGMNVHKCGRTTEYTSGTIDDISATVDVSYGSSGTARFVNQIITGDMSDGGDSGSVVLRVGPPPLCSLQSFQGVVGEDISEEIKISRKFRDKKLSRSGAGKHYLKIFSDLEPQIIDIIESGDPEVETILKKKGLSVLRGMIDGIKSAETRKPHSADDEKLIRYGKDVLRVFSEKGDKDLKKAIELFKKKTRRFKGKNVPEILAILDKEKINKKGE